MLLCGLIAFYWCQKTKNSVKLCATLYLKLYLWTGLTAEIYDDKGIFFIQGQ